MLPNLILLLVKNIQRLTVVDIHLFRHWRWQIIGLILFFSFEINAEPNRFEELNIRAGFFLTSFPYISRTDAEIGLKFWGEQVGKSQNINVNIDFYNNIKQMRADFDVGKINFIVASPIVILKNFERASLANGFTLSRQGLSSENLVIVTRQHESLDEFKNLVGKKIGLLSNDNISEAYLDFLSLKYLAQPYQKRFSKVVFFNKKTQLVYDLFFKKVDAIIIFESSYLVAAELNPQIKQTTQIISSLPDLKIGLGLFHKSVPAEFREKIISYWVNLGKTPGDQYLLQMFQSDTFERVSLEDLSSTEDFLSDYQGLLQHYKK